MRDALLRCWRAARSRDRRTFLFVAALVIVGIVHVVTARGYRMTLQWNSVTRVELAPGR